MATKPESTALQTEVPVSLLAEMQSLVDAGWFRSLDEVMLDALRRFLDSHRGDLMQGFLREDVEWGLRGQDFTGAVRGKYYERYQQGTNVVLLDADVAQAFKDSDSVNRALRLLLDLAQQEETQRR
jgi:Arc/MetJ-type ribon-helix-helix transcriptional regulator